MSVGVNVNFRALEKNQSEYWKSPANLFLKKITNPVVPVSARNSMKRWDCVWAS